MTWRGHWQACYFSQQDDPQAGPQTQTGYWIIVLGSQPLSNHDDGWSS